MPSIYTIVPKIMIIGYTVSEMQHLTDLIVIFHFGLFVAQKSQKNQIPKKMKKQLEILSFYTGYQKFLLDDVMLDGADGQKN